jgi:hypothetical protein
MLLIVALRHAMSPAMQLAPLQNISCFAWLDEDFVQHHQLYVLIVLLLGV